jgi:arginine decarboxylase
MILPEPRSDATASTKPAEWSIEKAQQHYNIGGWGAGYFSVNEKGHTVVHPHGQPGPVIDLMDVVEDIRERNLGFPCVVRFQDVLRDRVKVINEAFAKAVAEMGYGARYFGVYPIKVNQMREVSRRSSTPARRTTSGWRRAARANCSSCWRSTPTRKR